MRRGSGPPLLLINGIGAPTEMWAPLVERLDGHELVAFEQPGAGGSPPPPRPLRMRRLADLVAGLLDALGYRRVDVLGHSFGGILAQELARRWPRHVERLVLCATSPGLGGTPPKPLAALLMLTPVRYYSRSVAERVVPIIAGGRTRRDPRALASNLIYRLASPPTVTGYVHQLYAVTGWTSLPWLGRLPHPTLILHGSDDPLAPPGAWRRRCRMPGCASSPVEATCSCWTSRTPSSTT